MSEAALKRDVLDAVNATGAVRAWSSPAGIVKVRGAWLHLAPLGCPDIVGFVLRDGRFFGLEIKVPGNKTAKARAEAQHAFQSAIAENGGVVGQVESVEQAVALVRAAVDGRAE